MTSRPVRHCGGLERLSAAGSYVTAEEAGLWLTKLEV
jgi:hypothetical protein